jgi:hypothetical protein
MQARYYDPAIGRFYSNYPIEFRDVHSFNRYAYANNNPYKYIDPTGMSSEKGACGSDIYLCLNSNESATDTPSETIENNGAKFQGRMEDGTPRYEVTAKMSSLYNDAITGAEIGSLRSDMNDLQMDAGYLTLGLASIPTTAGWGAGQLFTRVGLMTPVEQKALFLAVDLALSVSVANMKKSTLSQQLPGTAAFVMEKARVVKGRMKIIPKPRKTVYPAQ